MTRSLVSIRDIVCACSFLCLIAALIPGPSFGSNACRRYATESVRQNRQNVDMEAGFTGSPWQSDFKVHYNWCIHGNNLATTPLHLASREKELQAFAVKGGIESSGRRYAREAVRQHDQSAAMGTGFKPPVWSGDFNGHFKWSLHGNNVYTTPDHLAAREKALQEFAIRHNKGPAAVDPNLLKGLLPKMATVTIPDKAEKADSLKTTGPVGRLPSNPTASVPRRPDTWKILLPGLMQQAERYFSGIPPSTDAEKGFAGALDANAETRKFYREMLDKYQRMPMNEKLAVYNPKSVTLYADPRSQVDAAVFKADIRSALAVPSKSATINLPGGETPAPRTPPVKLVALNKSGNPDAPAGEMYQIRLEWSFWGDRNSIDGFTIYRRKGNETDYSLLKTMTSNSLTLSFTDKGLPVPGSAKDTYCYRVKAYKKPYVTSLVLSNLVESEASNEACTPYHPAAGTSFADADADRVPDHIDWCPRDGMAPTIGRVMGCPDVDEDGYADRIDDPHVPADLKLRHFDNCPGESQDGTSSQYAHLYPGLRPFDPLPGCRVQYTLRFMGLEILNDPFDCARGDDQYGLVCDDKRGMGNENRHQVNEVVNGKTLPDGQEPYMIFSIHNGMNKKGSDDVWSKTWCCGEGVNVGSYNHLHMPTQVSPAGVEPDNDLRGAEDPAVDQQIRQGGYVIMPQSLQGHAVIDAIYGLSLAATLFERDFDLKYTPDSNEMTMTAALKKGLPLFKSTAEGLSAGGPWGALGGIAKGFAETIIGLFGDDGPDPVITRDADDMFGVSHATLSEDDAERKTRHNGTYGFFMPYPAVDDTGTVVDFHLLEPGLTAGVMKSYTGRLPMDSPSLKLGNMAGRAKFCLVRKGVDESQLRTLCSPYAWEHKLPFDMKVK